MSFAGLLGAGLLGGAGNAAKGIGDRLREEAKQKREFALQDRAEKKAQGLAETENDRAVEAAQKVRIAQFQRDRINNAALIGRQDNAGDIAADAATTGYGRDVEKTSVATGVAEDVAATRVKTDKVVVSDAVDVNAAVAAQGQTDALALQAAGGIIKTEQQKLGYAARLEQINLAKVGSIETFFDETSGMDQKWEMMASGDWEKRGGPKAPDASTSKGFTLQNGYNDKGEEIKGYMSGTSFVQVGAAKGVKVTTEKEALTYLTAQAKFLITGASNSFIATKLSDEDAALVSAWVDEGMTAWNSSGTPQNLSSIVKNVMFKPWKLKDSEITTADIDAAEQVVDANDKLDKSQLKVISRQIATRRQPDFIAAQTAYTNIIAAGGDTAALFKRMKKMGYSPDLLR